MSLFIIVTRVGICPGFKILHILTMWNWNMIINTVFLHSLLNKELIHFLSILGNVNHFFPLWSSWSHSCCRSSHACATSRIMERVLPLLPVAPKHPDEGCGCTACLLALTWARPDSATYRLLRSAHAVRNAHAHVRSTGNMNWKSWTERTSNFQISPYH